MGKPTFVGDEVAVIGSFAGATLGLVREPWGPHSAVRHSHCAATAQATPTATLTQTPTATAALWLPGICKPAALALPGVCEPAGLARTTL